MENINTTDLKALYDFACFHAELKTHTGTKEETKEAVQNRDILYKELERRVAIETLKLKKK